MQTITVWTLSASVDAQGQHGCTIFKAVHAIIAVINFSWHVGLEVWLYLMTKYANNATWTNHKV